jgi:hypothetical protein
MPKAPSANDIIKLAEQHVANAKGNVDALYAAMGAIGNDAPVSGFTVARGRLTFDADAMRKRGENLFKKFENHLKRAVCNDFKYCSKRKDVDAALKKYLPDIIGLLKKRIPWIGKMPAWLAAVLKVFRINAASLAVVVSFLVAWLIINGCNKLCNCKS